MNILTVFLVNGFLLSITPATVTDTKCSGKSPVIKENCNGVKPAPVVQPPQHPENGADNLDEKKAAPEVAPVAAPQSHAC